MRRTKAVKLLKDALLQCSLFKHRLNHKIGLLDRSFQIELGPNMGQDRLGPVLSQRAECDQAGKIGPDVFLRSGQTRLGARMHGHAIAGQGKLLCNTMAH